MKKVIALILAVTLGLLLVPSAVSAAGITVVGRTGDGVWIGDTWQVSIYPGETKSTTLTLYNSSSSSFVVEVTLPNPLEGGNITFELDKVNFLAPSGSYADVTLSVKANGSATPGTYTAELKIKSVVAPTPPAPPTEPEPEEPEVVEPEIVEPTLPEEPEEPEPVAPEPEEPEVVEPEEEPALPEEEEPEVVEEEPEVVEPEEEEPEVVEPEVIEPGEEEEVMVPPGTPWGLIAGLVGGLAAAGSIGYWLWRRRRKEANYGS